jgi:hypothetical protein
MVGAKTFSGLKLWALLGLFSVVEEKPDHFLTNLCLSHLTRFTDCPRVFRIREQIKNIYVSFILLIFGILPLFLQF